MVKIWTLFLQIRELFSILRGGARKISHPPPSSYTALVIRALRILLLTKFTLMKLKTDVFRAFSVLF